MNAPRVNIERDVAMSGYEVQISREGQPVVVLFLSDMGTVGVMAIAEDTSYPVSPVSPPELEFGCSYVYPRLKVPA